MVVRMCFVVSPTKALVVITVDFDTNFTARILLQYIKLPHQLNSNILIYVVFLFIYNFQPFKDYY